MNFKDRLDLIKTTNSFFIQNNDYIEVKNESDIADIFSNDEESINIIKEQLLLSKNIILASGVDCDKTLAAQYIKTLIPSDESIEVIYDISKDIQFINAKRIIVPDVNIVDFVKILEFILYGYKSFIFGINIKSNNNILESLKTLILLYYQNLNNKNIVNLLGMSDSVIVYIAKNSDGIFYISDIGELQLTDGDIKLHPLYSFDSKADNEVNEIHLPKEIPFEVYTAEPYSNTAAEEEINSVDEFNSETLSDIETFETVILTEDSAESEVIKEELIETETETVSPSLEPEPEEYSEENKLENADSSFDSDINPESVKKNKYKLLKEKIKNKKFNND